MPLVLRHEIYQHQVNSITLVDKVLFQLEFDGVYVDLCIFPCLRTCQSDMDIGLQHNRIVHKCLSIIVYLELFEVEIYLFGVREQVHFVGKLDLRVDAE